jgi:hypothetical protein
MEGLAIYLGAMGIPLDKCPIQFLPHYDFDRKSLGRSGTGNTIGVAAYVARNTKSRTGYACSSMPRQVFLCKGNLYMSVMVSQCAHGLESGRP